MVQILPIDSPGAVVFWIFVAIGLLIVNKVRKEGIGWLIATVVEMVYYEVQVPCLARLRAGGQAPEEG
jgi:hypothetical protein